MRFARLNCTMPTSIDYQETKGKEQLMNDDPTQEFPPRELDSSGQPSDESARELIAVLSTLQREVSSSRQAVEELNAKVEARIYDTRPLWEGVQTQLTDLRQEVQTQVGDLQMQITGLRQEVQTQITDFRQEVQTQITDFRQEVQVQFREVRDEMERGFIQLERQLDVVAGNNVRIKAEIREVESRVRNLESNAP